MPAVIIRSFCRSFPQCRSLVLRNRHGISEESAHSNSYVNDVTRTEAKQPTMKQGQRKLARKRRGRVYATKPCNAVSPDGGLRLSSPPSLDPRRQNVILVARDTTPVAALFHCETVLRFLSGSLFPIDVLTTAQAYRITPTSSQSLSFLAFLLSCFACFALLTTLVAISYPPGPNERVILSFQLRSSRPSTQSPPQPINSPSVCALPAGPEFPKIAF